jgi:hypothetical protein
MTHLHANPVLQISNAIQNLGLPSIKISDARC